MGQVGTTGCDDCQDAVTCGYYGKWKLSLSGAVPLEPEITLEITGCTGRERVSASSPALDCEVLHEIPPEINHRHCSVSAYVGCISFDESDADVRGVALEWYFDLEFSRDAGVWKGVGPAEACEEEDYCWKPSVVAEQAE